ncbi:hypothetical protein TNCV_1882511 [Trichonephila clavipes]|nr:hypothetical protein TNCV_1882511 [Trichonephila clavipes]
MRYIYCVEIYHPDESVIELNAPIHFNALIKGFGIFLASYQIRPTYSIPCGSVLRSDLKMRLFIQFLHFPPQPYEIRLQSLVLQKIHYAKRCEALSRVGSPNTTECISKCAGAKPNSKTLHMP